MKNINNYQLLTILCVPFILNGCTMSLKVGNYGSWTGFTYFLILMNIVFIYSFFNLKGNYTVNRKLPVIFMVSFSFFVLFLVFLMTGLIVEPLDVYTEIDNKSNLVILIINGAINFLLMFEQSLFGIFSSILLLVLIGFCLLKVNIYIHSKIIKSNKNGE